MLRSAFGGGPAFLTHDSVVYQMHDDSWDAKAETKFTDLRTNLQGTIGAQQDYLVFRLSFTPIATSVNLATAYAKLHPYRASDRGRLLFPDTDVPAIIQGKDGRALTFKTAAVITEPDLSYRTNAPHISKVEMLCILAASGDSADLSDYITEGSSAYVEPTLDPLTIINERYDLAWGATAPFDDIETDENGLMLKPVTKWKELPTMKNGLLNYRLEDKTATVEMTPVNLATADFLSVIPAVGRGAMRSNFAQELTAAPVSGNGPALTCPAAVPTDPAVRFGQEGRFGALAMALDRGSSLEEPYTLSVAVVP